MSRIRETFLRNLVAKSSSIHCHGHSMSNHSRRLHSHTPSRKSHVQNTCMHPLHINHMSPPSASLIAGPIVAGTVVLVLSATTLFVVYRRRRETLPHVTHDFPISRVPHLNPIEQTSQTHTGSITSDAAGPYSVRNTRYVTESSLIYGDRITEVAEQGTPDSEARRDGDGALRLSSGDVEPSVDLDLRDRGRTASRTFDVDRLMEIVRERMESADLERPQGATRREGDGALRLSSGDVDPSVDLVLRDRRAVSETFDVGRLMEIVRERMESADLEQPQGATRLESEVPHLANAHQNDHRCTPVNCSAEE